MNAYRFTQGNLLKQMISFSAPLMLTNILQVSYQLIDSLWVGNLIGANALGAVTVSSTVNFTVLSFILGINSAALTILSQQKGKEDDEGLKRYINAFVFLLSVLALILGAVGFFAAETILARLDTPPAILRDATLYLQINFLGVYFVFGYNFIGTLLRALGDSRTPLRFVFAAVVLNAVLDPLFIAGFQLGIEGAAYATVLSQSLSFFYGLALILRKKLAPLTIPRLPSLSEVKLILRLGIPSGLQMMVILAGAWCGKDIERVQKRRIWRRQGAILNRCDADGYQNSTFGDERATSRKEEGALVVRSERKASAGICACRMGRHCSRSFGLVPITGSSNSSNPKSAYSLIARKLDGCVCRNTG
mgnify:FL=1